MSENTSEAAFDFLNAAATSAESTTAGRGRLQALPPRRSASARQISPVCEEDSARPDAADQGNDVKVGTSRTACLADYSRQGAPVRNSDHAAWRNQFVELSRGRSGQQPLSGGKRFGAFNDARGLQSQARQGPPRRRTSCTRLKRHGSRQIQARTLAEDADLPSPRTRKDGPRSRLGLVLLVVEPRDIQDAIEVALRAGHGFLPFAVTCGRLSRWAHNIMGEAGIFARGCCLFPD